MQLPLRRARVTLALVVGLLVSMLFAGAGVAQILPPLPSPSLPLGSGTATSTGTPTGTGTPPLSSPPLSTPPTSPTVPVDPSGSIDPTDPPIDELCDVSAPIEAETLPTVIPPEVCDLIGATLLDNGIGAIVPNQGEGVYTQSHSETGVQEFGIEVDVDGVVTLRFVGDEEETSASRRGMFAAAGPCKDDSNSQVGYKAKSAYGWFMNVDSVPSKLDRDKVKRAAILAAGTVVRARNDCKLSSNLAAKHSFKGTTQKNANFKDGICDSPDGTSVFDFGSIERYGDSCAWYFVEDGADTLAESDIRMNPNRDWTFKPGADTCSNRLDVQGLLTHEMGHVFGLGHVGHDHGTLTMTEVLPMCSLGPRSLGLGDIRGLRKLY